MCAGGRVPVGEAALSPLRGMAGGSAGRLAPPRETTGVSLPREATSVAEVRGLKSDVLIGNWNCPLATFPHWQHFPPLYPSSLFPRPSLGVLRPKSDILPSFHRPPPISRDSAALSLCDSLSRQSLIDCVWNRLGSKRPPACLPFHIRVLSINHQRNILPDIQSANPTTDLA